MRNIWVGYEYVPSVVGSAPVDGDDRRGLLDRGAAPTSAGPVDIPGWDLVFQDEFDVGPPDTSKWELLNRQDSFNNEKQYYHPNQVTVADGNLQLTAIDVPRHGKDYQSGLITSRDLFGPGRFEARIDLPTSQGMWPAFWLNANHVAWPQGGEIDIMENRGSEPNSPAAPTTGRRILVLAATNINSSLMSTPPPKAASRSTSTPASTRTPPNGMRRASVTMSTATFISPLTEEPDRPIFETPKNIIVNLAVGGFFGGDPDGSTVWPQTMVVDYVRVWQRPDNPETGENLLSNPGFDDGGGSLDGWSVFGNTISNVSANGDLANDGTHALKIYGQFNGPNNLSGVSQGVAISEGASLRAEASTRTPSWDTLFGKDNDVTMKIEFYSVFGAASGSGDFLGEVSQLIHDGSSAEDIWLDHALEAIAPEDAVEARLSFVFRQPDNDNGAIWIDSAGLFLESIIDGDFDLDNDVDGADFLLWQRNPSIGSLADWQTNYGMVAPLSTVSAAVPEPSTLALLSLGGLLVLHRFRRATTCTA